jgi:exopolyphosphatase/guanosine-5'-triphosphate,3'-diphosphate pyrophosphatase
VTVVHGLAAAYERAGPLERAEPGATPETIAAIDIGTNSIHMVVARIASNDRFEVITREKEMVRLGSGLPEMKHLDDAAIDRGVDTLRRCRALADSWGAPTFAVATSAVREARNASEFIERARAEAGVEVSVISGREEARLIQLGVLQALPVYDTDLLLVDVGGGSTEVLLGRGSEVRYARSVKLGSLRLTREFFPDGVVERGAVRRCREQVRTRLASVVRETEDLPFEVAVASSGTAESLAAMVAARDGTVPQSLNGFRLAATDLGWLVDQLASAATPAERRELPGIDAARADILVGGAVLLEQVARLLEVEEFQISEYALREGVLLDGLHRLRGGSTHHLSDLRRASVFHLVELCDDDPDHAVQVARLALELHDALAGRLGLGGSERELLEAAALLANVGLFISHSRHHKHSYYVIRNSEHMMGFTDREVELIAQVARYHRRSVPSVEKHPEFAALTEPDQQLVRSLAAILRVAIGLDRNHDSDVAGLEVRDDGGVVRILATPVDGSDLEVEVATGSERAGLLAELLGADVVVSSAS